MLPGLNEAIGMDLFQHGPKLNGYMMGVKGTGPQTLLETTYMIGPNGYIETFGQGTMQELAARWLGANWRNMTP